MTRAVLVGPPTRFRTPRGAFLPGLRFFAGVRRLCASAPDSNRWMLFQIRVRAAFRLVNRCTGCTPGKLFQISTRRVAGHFSANAASSCSLLKVSPPLPSTCSVEAKAVMLFAVWTPKGFDWVYRRFISEERLKGHEAIQANPFENVAVLERQPDYYEQLKVSYDERFYEQ